MITGLNHITLAVTELNRSLSFYRDVLGCIEVHRWPEGVYLEAGPVWLCLSLCERVDVRTDYTHIAFSTTPEELPMLRARLERHRVCVWQDNASEGDSVYITDPDGHRLEVHVGSLHSRLAHLRSLQSTVRTCGTDL